MALREFVTLDPVALASFCESTHSTGSQQVLLSDAELLFASQPGCALFSVYFSALVLCLSQQMTSDRINLYPAFNATLW